MLARIKLDD